MCDINDKATHSLSIPELTTRPYFSGLKPNCFQEFDKDKLFSITELRGTSEMFATGCMLHASDVNLEHRIKSQKQLAQKKTNKTAAF